MSIKSAWERSDSGQAFNAALAEHGFAIEKGQKAGVWLIVKDGNQIGSLDRILKEKGKS